MALLFIHNRAYTQYTDDIVLFEFAADFFQQLFCQNDVVVSSVSSPLCPSDSFICVYCKCSSALLLHGTSFSGQNQQYWLPDGRLLTPTLHTGGVDGHSHPCILVWGVGIRMTINLPGSFCFNDPILFWPQMISNFIGVVCSFASFPSYKLNEIFV